MYPHSVSSSSVSAAPISAADIGPPQPIYGAPSPFGQPQSLPPTMQPNLNLHPALTPASRAWSTSFPLGAAPTPSVVVNPCSTASAPDPVASQPARYLSPVTRAHSHNSPSIMSPTSQPRSASKSGSKSASKSASNGSPSIVSEDRTESDAFESSNDEGDDPFDPTNAGTSAHASDARQARSKCRRRCTCSANGRHCDSLCPLLIKFQLRGKTAHEKLRIMRNRFNFLKDKRTEARHQLTAAKARLKVMKAHPKPAPPPSAPSPHLAHLSPPPPAPVLLPHVAPHLMSPMDIPGMAPQLMSPLGMPPMVPAPPAMIGHAYYPPGMVSIAAPLPSHLPHFPQPQLPPFFNMAYPASPAGPAPLLYVSPYAHPMAMCGPSASSQLHPTTLPTPVSLYDPRIGSHAFWPPS